MTPRFAPPFARPLAAAVTALMALAAGACATTPAAAPPGPGEAELIAFMRGYTDAWNRHDSAAIAREFYGMSEDVAAQSTSLERQFEALRAQGYTRSDIHSIEACLLSPAQGLAELRFTRLTADGGHLPPRDRASVYVLRRQEKGWRIVQLLGMDASADLACRSRTG